MEDEKDEPKTTIEELVEVILDEAYLYHKVLIGALLNKEERQKLANFLKRNKDVFAWSYRDMPGIDLVEAQHYLNIDSTFPLVQ